MRREIALLLLGALPLSQGEIRAKLATPRTRTGLGYHLRRLVATHVLSSRKAGRRVVYELGESATLASRASKAAETPLQSAAASAPHRYTADNHR